MKNCSPEKLAILATQIAIEMSRDKDISEINLLKTLTGQICSVLQTIVLQKINLKNDNFNKDKF